MKEPPEGPVAGQAAEHTIGWFWLNKAAWLDKPGSFLFARVFAYGGDFRGGERSFSIRSGAITFFMGFFRRFFLISGLLNG